MKYRSRCGVFENRPLEEGRQTDFRPIIACTKLVALLFATEEANKESGARKAMGRNPNSAPICCSELYEIKHLSAEMTKLQTKKAIPA
jgi:hypothetical protein